MKLNDTTTLLNLIFNNYVPVEIDETGAGLWSDGKKDYYLKSEEYGYRVEKVSCEVKL